MMNKVVQKDERTTFIENLSYSYGYKFIAFALLFDIMYRSLRSNEASWDLLAIIIFSGFIMTGYQYKQKILGYSWAKTMALTFVLAIISALIMVLVILNK